MADLCLTFSVDDASSGFIHDLVDGGRDKDVTNENVDEYLTRYREFVLEERLATVIIKVP